jgi:hypothetical protein
VEHDPGTSTSPLPSLRDVGATSSPTYRGLARHVSDIIEPAEASRTLPMRGDRVRFARQDGLYTRPSQSSGAEPGCPGFGWLMPTSWYPTHAHQKVLGPSLDAPASGGSCLLYRRYPLSSNPSYNLPLVSTDAGLESRYVIYLYNMLHTRSCVLDPRIRVLFQ